MPYDLSAPGEANRMLDAYDNKRALEWSDKCEEEPEGEDPMQVHKEAIENGDEGDQFADASKKEIERE